MADARSYGAGSYLFTLNDSPSIVKSISGGTPVAEVVTISTGPDKTQKKSISNLKYEDVKLEIGMSMSQSLIDTLNSFLDNKHERVQCSITYGDFDKKARGYLDLRDCLLTEFTIPACDAGNKEVGYFTIGLATEQSVARKGDAADLKGVLNVKQKAFLPSNFKLSIGDLPCKRVNKIESISFKCKVQEDQVGEVRIQTKEPTAMENGNLTITLSAADEEKWDQWFDDFCIKGNNGDDKELSGAIEWLDPSTKSTIATLEIQHIGIFKITKDSAEAGKDAIRRIKVDMYFETARFKLGG